MSWETTIRTGHPSSDQTELERLRGQARAQGLELQVSPLPQGGLHVRAVPTQQQGYAPQGYAPQSYGAAPAGGYGAPHAYGAPASAPQGYGQPAFAAPSQFSGMPAPGGFDPSRGGFGPSNAAGADAQSLTPERVRYLRKVYSLLAISALFAVGAGAAAITVGTEPVDLGGGQVVDMPLAVNYMLGSPALMWGTFGLLFVGTFVAGAVSRVPGLNLAALFGVSALMGLQLAPMMWVAEYYGGMGEAMSSSPIRDAGLMVLAVFGGLTSYVFITKKDFSFLRATLSMGFWMLLVACLLSFVFGSEAFSLAVASMGSIIAVGFLLYQTSYIMKHSDMDDPVGDALGLIVQIRNLFMFLLRILMSRR